MFHNPVLSKVARSYGKTIAQIILRFFIQENVIVIPKSLNRDHAKENISVFDFELNEADMEIIRSLDTGKTLFYWP